MRQIVPNIERKNADLMVFFIFNSREEKTIQKQLCSGQLKSLHQQRAFYLRPMNIYTRARVCVSVCAQTTNNAALSHTQHGVWPRQMSPSIHLSIKPSLYSTAIICALIESNWVAEHALSRMESIRHTSVSAPHDLPIASSLAAAAAAAAERCIRRKAVAAWKYL